MAIDYYSDPVGHCIEAFESENSDHRYNAADILRGLAADAEPALAVICSHMLSDQDIEVRRQCAFALVDIGYALKAKAQLAIPYLEKARKESDPELVELANDAIRSINT